jgi:hypothetical protein
VRRQIGGYWPIFRDQESEQFYTDTAP